MSKLIIAHAVVDTRTHTKDQMIALFAFFILSSSHAETKYIIQATTKARTDSTAIYWIVVEIRFHANAKKLSDVTELFTCPTLSVLHPGSQLHTTPGHDANIFAIKIEYIQRNNKIFFFIKVIKKIIIFSKLLIQYVRNYIYYIIRT